MENRHPACTPSDAQDLHGRTNAGGYPVMVILERRSCWVVRSRARYDQGGADFNPSTDFWEYHELEIVDGRRVLVCRDLSRERRWMLLCVMDPGVHLMGRDGGRSVAPWRTLRADLLPIDEGGTMADTRTATPYDELAEMVAGLDMLMHTWSVPEVLQGAPDDDPEDAQNVRSYVHNARRFLEQIDEALRGQ